MGMKKLDVPEEHLETLVKLGLTRCQAKAYFVAIQSGISTAKNLSREAKIARPDIYRVITSLEKMGLIEKSLDKPTVIKAIPLQEGISFLVQRRKQETLNIIQRTQRMVQDFTKYESKTREQEYKSQFVLFPQKEAYIRKLGEEIDNAQTSIDAICSWKRLPLTTYTFIENAIQALERNVKIRVILEKPKKHLLSETMREINKYPSFMLRYIRNPPLVILCIFDRKRIFVDTHASAGLGEVPALWTNNPSCVELARNYFETLGNTAIEKSTIKPKYKRVEKRMKTGTFQKNE
jgi:sugar-specific transcriptional regulator TrmB